MIRNSLIILSLLCITAVFSCKGSSSFGLPFEDKPLQKKKVKNKNGGFKGRVLVKGKPLANARIKAVRITRKVLIPGVIEGSPAMDKSFEARSDKNGYFEFNNIPPGGYKLWVQPKGMKAWIRRIKMVPDVIIDSGEVKTIKDFNIKAIAGD